MLIHTDNTTANPAGPASSNEMMATAGMAASASKVDGQTPIEVEEIRTGQEPVSQAQTRKAVPEKKEEPSPLLLDPYDFDRCAITIVYSRVGDRQASVSVYNHKDDPIVKTFPLVEVPLPEEVACVIEKLLEIWPDGKISATMVLLPQEDETERRMVVSIRTGNDTPIVLTGTAPEFPLPPSITTLLEELKKLLPARAMQKIEKEVKERSRNTSRLSTGKASSSTAKPASASVDGKTQMTLF